MSENPEEQEPKKSVPNPEDNLALYALICDSMHLLDAVDVCVAVNAPKISEWYLKRIGVPVTIQAWNEIERTIIKRLQELKPLLKSKNKRVIIRLVGPCREWFAMKMYKTLYPHADVVQFVGDAVFDI